METIDTDSFLASFAFKSRCQCGGLFAVRCCLTPRTRTNEAHRGMNTELSLCCPCVANRC